MTIKEVETLSGLPRANIRYYESEGLIAPKRAENGYREYSQADIDVLLRVKLLRALGLRIDTIKLRLNYLRRERSRWRARLIRGWKSCTLSRRTWMLPDVSPRDFGRRTRNFPRSTRRAISENSLPRPRPRCGRT